MFFFSFTDSTDARRENAICLITDVSFSYQREQPQPTPHLGEVGDEQPQPAEKPDTLCVTVQAFASEDAFRSGKRAAEVWECNGIPFDRHSTASMHKQAYAGVLALSIFAGAVSPPES